MTFATSAASATILSPSPWAKTPDWYKEKLRELLSSHIRRLQNATSFTLDQIARERLGWSRGNHLSQLTSPKLTHILSPASTLSMAKALELDGDETDQLVIIVMRANSDKGYDMTPEFLHRYEMAAFRKVCEKAKERGIRLY